MICDKIKYRILASEKNLFSNAVDDLLAQIPENEAILRLIFFGSPDNNEEYLSQYAILSEKVEAVMGSEIPVLTYVSQPALNAALLLEIHSYTPEKEEHVYYRSENGFPYVLLENKLGRFLFAGAFREKSLTDSIEKQSAYVFLQIDSILKKEKFPINSIIRQWNYIERITDFDGANQHYQSFNNARADFYGKTEWIKGYPAATGIGANLGGVLIDLDAVVLTSDDAIITPINNHLQIAAHAYSERVLENAASQKKTPKFERAKSLSFNGQRFIYVSGTAAIRGEESLKNVGVAEQLRITMENIGELMIGAKLLLLRVYLKNKSDFEESRDLLEAMHLNIPVSYVWADICRNELLIEIEGVAIE